MTTFNWQVVQMERTTDTDFVVTVHYNVSATDEGYSASTYGTVGYTQEEGNIIPFDSLTPEIVIGWVKDKLGEQTVEDALASQIKAQQNPVQLSGLPWITETPVV